MTHKSYRLALIALTFLAACGARGELGFVTSPDQVQEVETVFVATSRVRNKSNRFDRRRSHKLTYNRYQISIPPSHQTGNIEWPEAKPNPETDFAIATVSPALSNTDFKTNIKQAMSASKTREVQVFVHGFNTNYAESLYRVAQLKYDYQAETPIVLYSWPSAARLRLYAYDRDSVLFARNGLEEVLTNLADANVGKISLVAHSLGSALLMETLRQIYRDADPHVKSKIKSVVLLSPDLDVDVFNTQIADITPLPQPFVIVGSRKDKALALMQRIAGETVRLGDNMNTARIHSDGIEILDISEFTDGDKLNHFTIATSPSFIAKMKQQNAIYP